MSADRDPVGITGTKVAWTDGHVAGFIPWSMFVVDESSNLGNKKETLFYQVFGFQPAAWRSIDEYPYPEATPSDWYDAINFRGRWGHLIYHGGLAGHAESPDFKREHDNANFRMESAKQRLAAAGLQVRDPDETPFELRLVPDWTSVISHDRHLELVEAEKEGVYRQKVESGVGKICAACRSHEKLFGDGYRFYHRQDFAFKLCAANESHKFLKTEAHAAYSGSSANNYRLLKGHLDRYNKLNSSKRLIRSHSAYRKLLEMGQEAVPFILNDLRKGRAGGIWTAEVLAELTGRRGGDPQWWEQWAKSEKYEVLEDA